MNVWGYVALADAYDGRGREGKSVPEDLPKAISILEKGLKAAGGDPHDGEALRERLKDLQDRLAAGREPASSADVPAPVGAHRD